MIAKKGFGLGTFLDIESAFDNVSFDAISEAINNSLVDPALLPQDGLSAW